MTDFENATILEALARSEELTEWEIDFIDTVAEYDHNYISLSDKEKATLEELAVKLELEDDAA